MGQKILSKVVGFENYLPKLWGSE